MPLQLCMIAYGHLKILKPRHHRRSVVVILLLLLLQQVKGHDFLFFPLLRIQDREIFAMH